MEETQSIKITDVNFDSSGRVNIEYDHQTFFLTKTAFSAKNKLQEALMEAAKPWDRLLIKSTPEAIRNQVIEVVKQLNAEHPRCSELWVPHIRQYKGTDPGIYIQFGNNETIMSISLRTLTGVGIGLKKGGIIIHA
jgi:hypothetical protein